MTTEVEVHTNGYVNGNASKPDWDLVRLAYVQGRDTPQGLEWPTLEGLAREYGIPAPTIRSRAHREKWQDQRNNFHAEFIQRARRKTLEQLADKAALLDVQAFSVARATFVMAAKKLNQSLDPNQPGKELTLGEQERLLKVCDLAHKMGRRALGIGGPAIDTSD